MGGAPSVVGAGLFRVLGRLGRRRAWIEYRGALAVGGEGVLGCWVVAC